MNSPVHCTCLEPAEAQRVDGLPRAVVRHLHLLRPRHLEDSPGKEAEVFPEIGSLRRATLDHFEFDFEHSYARSYAGAAAARRQLTFYVVSVLRVKPVRRRRGHEDRRPAVCKCNATQNIC